ncbi:sodium ion-translocating decarboxylase subunit beta [Sporosalibacterium faouarense]|uniref:sodium ion-translocating decarboxylase subunit beta n=1 Tax=Sporosalibacterium faouarense TaxID=516123 RepID=UPI00141CC6E9|nr:sodium ion-translocating decarboxylase subunit beta [Bacillota bacterium]
MYGIGGLLILLAIWKDYEPMLLLPIGFGAILANIPVAPGIIPGITSEEGVLGILREAGIITELFPALIFIAVGAMIDFEPLLKMPSMLFFGAAAQVGIFMTLTFALLTGEFTVNQAAAIGIIGAADGPTSIFVAAKFAKDLLGPISVAAYSYMSMVPIIQPRVIKLLTTKKERKIRMEYREIKVSKKVKILFPILVTIIAGIIAPISVTLIGLLMFGNLIRESGVVERLSKSAQNELANLVTLLLGITIGSTMEAADFVTKETAIIMGLGLFAFIFDTAGGVLFAKFLNLFVKKKYNPMVGAAGISAFPMSARVIQKMAREEDPTNFILMQAVSANVAGQIGSIIAGSVIISMLSKGVG